MTILDRNWRCPEGEIDIVARDIDRPLREQGGVIVEVNAGPGLLMHLKPAVGSPRPVGRAICDHLFPETGDDTLAGRIPVVGVAGSRDTAVLARLVAWLIGLSGHHTGLACRDGLFLDRRRVDARDSAHWDAGHRLLVNRAVQTTLPPGSTFKVVTAAAAIESGKYTADGEVPGGPTYQLPQTTGRPRSAAASATR